MTNKELDALVSVSSSSLNSSDSDELLVHEDVSTSVSNNGTKLEFVLSG